MTEAETTTSHPTIVIADRGWVWVGRIGPEEHPDHLRLTDASCIRRWGTTRGLGELSLGGPTSSTILDPCGTVIIPRRAVIALLPCATLW